MEFNSQICTTKTQSERLLALGLKKETADCQYAALVVDWKGDPISNLKWRFYDHNKGFIVQNFERIERIPAWSLHRLIEIMPYDFTDNNNTYELQIACNGAGYDDLEDLYSIVGWWSDNTYDDIIACIEWLIKAGYFNKEYLE
jgi:hypothetical protein